MIGFYKTNLTFASVIQDLHDRIHLPLLPMMIYYYHYSSFSKIKHLSIKAINCFNFSLWIPMTDRQLGHHHQGANCPRLLLDSQVYNHQRRHRRRYPSKNLLSCYLLCLLVDWCGQYLSRPSQGLWSSSHLWGLRN